MIDIASFSLSQALNTIPVSGLWIALGIFALLALAGGAALIFHWNKYKLHSTATDMTKVIYCVGLLSLLGLCATALAFYSLQ